MTVAISKAVEEGATAVICASTGNTSASAAAYAAAAGLDCAVLVPDGKIAIGKLAQALAHGARLLQVEGNFDDCLASPASSPSITRSRWSTRSTRSASRARRRRRSRSSTPSATPRTSTACRSATPATSRPTGRATGSTPTDGLAPRPRMWGFQAAGAAPIVLGDPVENPETIATAIRIGNPASWDAAIAARDESGGRIDAVTDEQILAAQRLLSSREGVFVEPASAASVAGLLQCHAQGALDPGQVVVCTVTGNGLKDTETALSQLRVESDTVPADVAAAAAALGLTAPTGRATNGRGSRSAFPATSANLGPGFDALGLALGSTTTSRRGWPAGQASGAGDRGGPRPSPRDASAPGRPVGHHVRASGSPDAGPGMRW